MAVPSVTKMIYSKCADVIYIDLLFLLEWGILFLLTYDNLGSFKNEPCSLSDKLLGTNKSLIKMSGTITLPNV